MQFRYKVLLVLGLVLVFVGSGVGGYGLWYNSAHYVSTKDAQVVADLVQVGSVNPGRITGINVHVGATVLEGQVVATVDIPAVISRSDITDTTKVGFRDVQEQRADVVAPRSGVVAARWAMEGDTVSAGQRIVTLMDPSQVWIEANIDESKVGRVRPGQLAEIDVAGLDAKMIGRVDTVWPVTAAILQLGPNPSNNVRKVAQVVPIKITFDEESRSLIPGSSAKVKIRVRYREES